MTELAVRWYLQMLDAGMRKCEADGRPSPIVGTFED
jgi:hypothetical protein